MGKALRDTGEVHQRTDTSEPVGYQVLIVSHNLYRDATGMVFVVPVLSDAAGADHPLIVRTHIAGRPALIICDQVFRMPAAGLGEPPIGIVEPQTLERIRSQFRGIFS